jgi:hypothetical protein
LNGKITSSGGIQEACDAGRKDLRKHFESFYVRAIFLPLAFISSSLNHEEEKNKEEKRG